MGEKVRHIVQNQNKKANTQILARAENGTRDSKHRSLALYLSATETTERINWSRAI